MTAHDRADALAEARRRFGPPATPASDTAREWTVDELRDKPSARGLAEAAARQGNRSARRALDDLQAETARTRRDDLFAS